MGLSSLLNPLNAAWKSSRTAWKPVMTRLVGLARADARAARAGKAMTPYQAKKFLTGKRQCDENLILKEVYQAFPQPEWQSY